MDDITDSMDMYLSKHQELVKDREPWCAAAYLVATTPRAYKASIKRAALLNPMRNAR